jgi:hypothetical protein
MPNEPATKKINIRNIFSAAGNEFPHDRAPSIQKINAFITVNVLLIQG